MSIFYYHIIFCVIFFKTYPYCLSARPKESLSGEAALILLIASSIMILWHKKESMQSFREIYDDGVTYLSKYLSYEK